MPLSSPTLNTQLTNLLDKDSGGFVEFGTNPAQVATKWADAIDAYASAVIPVSTGAAAAKSAFIAALTPGVAPGAFMAALASAFTAYALALGAGMAPAFVAVPPPSPIVLPVLPATAATTATVVVSTWAPIIDTWFRTGTATPSGVGAPILWS